MPLEAHEQPGFVPLGDDGNLARIGVVARCRHVTMCRRAARSRDAHSPGAQSLSRAIKHLRRGTARMFVNPQG